MVLGTVQLGTEYGITNLSGKPVKNEAFSILELAWESGIYMFDTAPDYNSEEILGDFILVNKIQNEIKILTKIPSLQNSKDYKSSIKKSIESSMKNLRCSIDVLFFHNPLDSMYLLQDIDFFASLIKDYQINFLGLSVYEPDDIDRMVGCEFDLAFQFPFNVLDRRFEKVKISKGNRYARSIFLQGLLASSGKLNEKAPRQLVLIQKIYHDKLNEYGMDAIDYAISFIINNSNVDYFLFGVENISQLEKILNTSLYGKDIVDIVMELDLKEYRNFFNPNNWNIN